MNFSKSKRLCWLAVGVPNLCVYTHAYKRPCTHIEDPVVHVRVWWIIETRKKTTPACTCTPKMECGCPSGRRVQNGHICYPSHEERSKHRKLVQHAHSHGPHTFTQRLTEQNSYNHVVRSASSAITFQSMLGLFVFPYSTGF